MGVKVHASLPPPPLLPRPPASMNSPGFHERGHALKQGTEIPAASSCSQGWVLSKERSLKKKKFGISFVQDHRHIAYALGSNTEKKEEAEENGQEG